MRLNFTVAGMPAAETAILGIGSVALNLTVITPPRDDKLTDTPAPTNSLPTDKPVPTAIVQGQTVSPRDDKLTDTPAPTNSLPTDKPVPTAIVQGQTVSPTGVLTSLTSDRPELTVGDPVTLTLGVMHAHDQAVVLPRIGPEWGPFEVWSHTTTQTISNGDGTKTTFRQFRVTLFATGEFETPDLPIAIRRPDGIVEEVFPTPLRLTVKSVLSGPDEQLKDLRSPAELSTPFWEQPVVLALAALAVLAAAAATGYYLYRRSHRLDTTARPVVDMRSPWEVAIQELDRIDRIDLPGSGDLREHYTLVSGVIRVYLGTTYLRDAGRMEATEMSTEEIGAAISQSSLDYGNTRLVIELLREADLVKFANYAPLVSRAYEASSQVRNLVEVTRLPSGQAAPGGASVGQAGAA